MPFTTFFGIKNYPLKMISPKRRSSRQQPLRVRIKISLRISSKKLLLNLQEISGFRIPIYKKSWMHIRIISMRIRNPGQDVYYWRTVCRPSSKHITFWYAFIFNLWRSSILENKLWRILYVHISIQSTLLPTRNQNMG